MNLDAFEVKPSGMIDYTLITTLRKIGLLTKRQVCKYCNIYMIEKEEQFDYFTLEVDTAVISRRKK